MNWLSWKYMEEDEIVSWWQKEGRLKSWQEEGIVTGSRRRRRRLGMEDVTSSPGAGGGTPRSADWSARPIGSCVRCQPSQCNG